MLVPFISWPRCRVQVGTEVMAAPGAVSCTPCEPSCAGPRLDQVVIVDGCFSSMEYSASIIAGVTKAPQEMIASHVPPGAPTVV